VVAGRGRRSRHNYRFNLFGVRIMTPLTQKQMALIATAGCTASEMLRAGCTVSQMLRAGFTASQMLDAGCTASQMREAGFTADIPLLIKPYTSILADIDAGARLFRQDTFGPDGGVSKNHLCKTAMCTAGHLVHIAGLKGKKLKEKYGFAGAAALIHAKANPDYPCQNFGSIKDKFALAYIREMAEVEKGAAS
jgi:hypothetical protein